MRLRGGRRSRELPWPSYERAHDADRSRKVHCYQGQANPACRGVALFSFGQKGPDWIHEAIHAESIIAVCPLRPNRKRRAPSFRFGGRAVSSIAANRHAPFVPLTTDRPAKAGEADARDSGRRSAALAALLSLGHKSSLPILKIWTEGARVDIPAIPNFHPKHLNPLPLEPPSNAKRGCVSEFTPKSRRNLQRTLATMKIAEESYTMALTLPGGDDANILPHETVIRSFRTLLRRFANVSAFKGVSGFWKRELQMRGALHYHLLVYGISCPVARARFQTWIVGVWNKLVCVGLTDTQVEHHRWWHARAENMQQVEDMSGYFAKYLGKEDVTGALRGRWWGSFNKQALPVSMQERAVLTEKAAVLIHRVARKLRQVKANAGKHRAISKRMEKTGFKLSEMQLFRLRSGYDIQGYRTPFAATYLACHKKSCKFEGVRPGKFRFRGAAPMQASIVLCGKRAPSILARLVAYASERVGLPIEFYEGPSKSRDGFIPDPLRAVPPERTPIRKERQRKQTDFLGSLGAFSRPPETLFSFED